MSDITKRVSALSPEKRELLEILLREKGVKSPLSEIGSKQPSSKTVKLTRFPNSPLVGIRTQGSKPPFFLVHPSEGSILCYVDLVRHIDTDHTFYGLQTPGLDGESEPHNSIEELATNYIEAIKTVQNQGPFFLGGWSMGGIVAYEMAQRLLEQGQKVSLLIVIDTTSTAYSEKYLKEEMETFLQNIPGLSLSLKNMDFSSDSYSDYLSDEHVRSILELAKKSGFISSDFGLTQVERYFKIFKTNNLAQLSYVQQVYPGKIIFFKASELINDHDPTIGWNDLAKGGIETYDVPGNHFTIMKEPNVLELARRLKDCLDVI